MDSVYRSRRDHLWHAGTNLVVAVLLTSSDATICFDFEARAYGCSGFWRQPIELQFDKTRSRLVWHRRSTLRICAWRMWHFHGQLPTAYIQPRDETSLT